MRSLVASYRAVLAFVWISLLSFIGLGDVPLKPVTVSALEDRIRAELDAGHLTGVAIALVSGDKIVYNRGHGWADLQQRRSLDENTIFRVGSISKLFNALAVMQQVEEGRLNLDGPVAQYLPNFEFVSTFQDAQPVTLRQILCHRSGILRESPVGNYFDPSEPGVEATARSIAGCPLIHPPGTQTKYSNSGPTLAGWAVQEVSGHAYDVYQKERILTPLGMFDSSFLSSRSQRSRMAKGVLPVARPGGGFEVREAPQFEFGILPAGNLYSTSGDLARFAHWILRASRGEGGQPILRAGSIEEMLKVQLTEEANGFGLGFSLGNYRGFRTVGHMGAVYGFTSSLLVLPKAEVAAVVLANDDIAIGSVRRLVTGAIDLLLQERLQRAPEDTAKPHTLTAEELASFTGDYESESFWARIDAASNHLKAIVSGQEMRLTPVATNEFLAYGRLADGAKARFQGSDDSGSVPEFTLLGQTFRRMDPAKASALPPSWNAYLGSFGPDFIPLIVSFRHGRLYAMTENEYDYHLTPVTENIFKMPPGLYVDEYLVFHPDPRGRVRKVSLANIPLTRRSSR